MRANQQELLNAHIQLAMHELGYNEISATERKIIDDGIQTYTTQAGILELSVPTVDVMKQTIKALSNTSFNGVRWSDRVWHRQEGLNTVVRDIVDAVTMRGRNPLEFQSLLRQKFQVGAYEAKRLAITESARVQTGVQKENYLHNGIEKYEYMAEPTACPICAALDGKTFKVSEMEPGTNACPMHPFCRCSTGPVPDEEGLEAMFRELEAEKEAERLLEIAKEIEPQITQDLKEITKQIGASLEGLAFRMKSKESLTRKILFEPQAKMRDVVRFTSVSEADRLVADYFEIVEKLEEKGYTLSAVKNTWTKQYTSYKGVNTNMLTPEGYEFELQYHTPESFELKNGELHKLYEEQRLLDPFNDHEKISKLDKRMFELSSKLIVPDNIENIVEGE